MLEHIVESEIIYYVMGAAGILGVLSKLIVSITLKKLVKAASDMSKSTHRFMKLVRAKFEHACMVNERVDNVDVFVSKYIQEYRVVAMSLNTWQRLERFWVYIILVAAITRTISIYYYVEQVGSMLRNEILNSIVFTCSFALIEIIALLVIYQIGDEKYKMSSIKIYMVDYLENICALRLQKQKDRENKSDSSISRRVENNRIENRNIHNYRTEGKKTESDTVPSNTAVANTIARSTTNNIQESNILETNVLENKMPESAIVKTIGGAPTQRNQLKFKSKVIPYEVEHVELENIGIENTVSIPCVNKSLDKVKRKSVNPKPADVKLKQIISDPNMGNHKVKSTETKTKQEVASPKLLEPVQQQSKSAESEMVQEITQEIIDKSVNKNQEALIREILEEFMA